MVPQAELPHARFFGSTDQRGRVPVSVVWELTRACDLSCCHCGSRAGRRARAELSSVECLDLVDQLAELGARDIGLIGGEVYLRRDWLEIVRRIRQSGMDCSVQTGGRFFTPATLDAAIEAGVMSIGVSLDGVGQTHDLQRGVPGSFEAALALLRRVAGRPIMASVNTQINRHTMMQLPELLDVLIAAKVSNWQLALTVAMGNAADNDDLLLQPYDLLALFPLLASLHDRAAEHGIVLQPSNNIGYFGPYEEKLRLVGDIAAHWTGCSAGDNVLGIEADGKIKGCPGLSRDYVGGNVRDEPLRLIWDRAERLAFTHRATKSDLWGYCAQCYYAEICMAGCTWTAHSLMGRPGNNPMCHYRALEFARRGKRERLVKVADAPGHAFDYGRHALVVEDMPLSGRTVLS